MRVLDYTVVIEVDEDGKYLAICPALQGCYSEGDTKEEALEMIKDAMKLHIEERIENGELFYQEVFFKPGAGSGMSSTQPLLMQKI